MESSKFKEIYYEVMQVSANKSGLSLKEYLELDGNHYQLDQGYYEDPQEYFNLIDRCKVLVELGKRRLSKMKM